MRETSLLCLLTTLVLLISPLQSVGGSSVEIQNLQYPPQVSADSSLVQFVQGDIMFLGNGLRFLAVLLVTNETGHIEILKGSAEATPLQCYPPTLPEDVGKTGCWVLLNETARGAERVQFTFNMLDNPHALGPWHLSFLAHYTYVNQTPYGIGHSLGFYIIVQAAASTTATSERAGEGEPFPLGLSIIVVAALIVIGVWGLRKYRNRHRG
jgi:hypothetical protein